MSSVEFIMKFIIDKALILVPALYIVGMIIKHTTLIPDKYIPIVLLACGIPGAIWLMEFSPESVIQGILVTGAAVYFNQLIKQYKNR